MGGFTDPDDELHKRILKEYGASIQKDMAATVLYTVMSALFIVILLSAYSGTGTGAYLAGIAVFLIMGISGITGIKKYGLNVLKQIRERKYQIRDARIAKLIPGAVSQSGRATAKIMDDDGTVYNQEFAADRKIRKAYRKAPDTAFTIIRVGEGKLYGLTCINRKPVAAESRPEKNVET